MTEKTKYKGFDIVAVQDGKNFSYYISGENITDVGNVYFDHRTHEGDKLQSHNHCFNQAKFYINKLK